MKQLRPYQQDAVNECWKALKLNDDPVLLMASVGAGKSLMLASILLSIQQANKKALCLVNNAELVRNNCATFIDQGGNGSIYCAALGEKNDNEPIIFGTPQSILNGIIKNERIAKIKFNLIVVDEAHTINFINHSTVFMRILRHYKQEYNQMRLLGATGTNFRYKGTEIVGNNCLFKKQVGNITTEKLIADGYLIDPTFKVDKNLLIDFSHVKIKKNGTFDTKQLESVIEKSARLTELICKQIIHIMEIQGRFGIFLFATTKKHAEEILSHLPETQSALILGETPQEERTRILNDAREGKIKYLVNIAIISVGIDVPAYDTIAYLRPTESLVLLIQTMGRALRLSERTGKHDALILDFAANIERHADWDNPILLKAIHQTIEDKKELVIKCPRCMEMNTEHARRCVGLTNNKRCDYYFEFKPCPNEECKIQNDIAARHCRLCNTEIIDPNEKLSLKQIEQSIINVDVLEAKYGITGTQRGFRINCAYKCSNDKGRTGVVFEHFSPINDKAMRVFYGQFVKQHCDNASKWYMHLHNRKKIEEMLQTAQTPQRLSIIPHEDGFKIKKKYFEIRE